MDRLSGKIAIVTGAARGTGEAIARRFVAEGARVLLADVLDAECGKVAADLGEHARFQHLDVTQARDWERAVSATAEHFGPVNVLVNNAAILHMAAIEDTRPEDFERVLRVNTVGTFLGIRSVVEPMKAAGAGSIVNVTSIDSLQGKNGVAAYASSKWASRGLTKVAALELGRYGIRVNAVAPEAGSASMVQPYVPDGLDIEKIMLMYQRRLATQEGRSIGDRLDDIARLVAFLASDESASCTGADFPIESGNTAGTIVPGPGSG